MTAPGADELVRDAAAAILARTGAKVTLIKDSPGFIAQRMVAMIANLGCEMAMIGIASAADVDTAMTLGLNYPRGPLALADWLGVSAMPRDPGAAPGHHRRRPLPAEPVAEAPRAARLERDDGGVGAPSLP